MKKTVVPTYFYKYYSMTGHGFKNLEDKKISFVNIALMNDPCEAISYVSVENSVMDDKSKELQFLTAQYEADMIHDTAKSLLAFCVTDSPINKLMWAHYAEAYKGFCVQYKKEDIEKLDIIDSSLKKVTYRKKPPLFKWNGNNIEVELVKMMKNKGICWRYEKEWRAICHGQEFESMCQSPRDPEKIAKIHEGILALGDTEYEPFILKDCRANAVFIGLNMSDENRKKIIELCHKQEIPCYVLEKKGYQIRWEEIKTFA